VVGADKKTFSATCEDRRQLICGATHPVPIIRIYFRAGVGTEKLQVGILQFGARQTGIRHLAGQTLEKPAHSLFGFRRKCFSREKRSPFGRRKKRKSPRGTGNKL